jgi:hypothetical protein
MSHIFCQDNGIWTMTDGTTYQGWSGNNEAGQDENNPDAQNIKGHGPIDRGLYTIVGPIDPPDHLGPFAFHLVPDADNDMGGRGGFCLHGEEAAHPELSSDGCIIQQRPAREAIGAAVAAGDNRLQVVA